MNFQRIAVVGAGAWGTALANTAARAGRDVTLWARDPAIVTQLTTKRENPRLPRIRLDNRIAATGAIAGPTTTNLVITSPSGLSATAPVITSTPTGGIVTFQGTSVGAADMKFFVDSNEVLGTTTNNYNGTWSFNCPWDPSTDGADALVYAALAQWNR